MEGFIAAVLLLIGGKEALSALQTAVISTGLPFVIILTLMNFLLIDSIKKSYKKQKKIKERDHFEEMIEEFDIQTDENKVRVKVFLIFFSIDPSVR